MYGFVIALFALSVIGTAVRSPEAATRAAVVEALRLDTPAPECGRQHHGRDPHRRRAERGGVAAGAGRHRVPAARSQGRRAGHVQTEARIVYDASFMYVAVTALDPEPAKIVGHRTRRDERSPSDWIRVMIDSFHDKRSAFEFAVNPAGVKQDSTGSTTANRRWLGRGVGRVGGHDGGRLAGRVPHSVLAAALSADRDATFGLAFVRQIGRLNETSTWPLLSKNATGYVSSFGDLTGLRLDRVAQAARAGALSGRRRDHAAGRDRQHAVHGHDPDSTSAST